MKKTNPLPQKLHWHEIRDEESEFRFEGTEPWIRSAVAELDEDSGPVLPGRPPTARAAARPITLELRVHRLDEVAWVKGHVATRVQLLCSRCGNEFDFSIESRFTQLFSQSAELAGVDDDPEDRVSGRVRGKARHEHDWHSDRESDDSLESATDITYLGEEPIDFRAVLQEQLRLVIPYQPLCREDCQGVCATCGADRNRGRCACDRLATNPFAQAWKARS